MESRQLFLSIKRNALYASGIYHDLMKDLPFDNHRTKKTGDSHEKRQKMKKTFSAKNKQRKTKHDNNICFFAVKFNWIKRIGVLQWNCEGPDAQVDIHVGPRYLHILLSPYCLILLNNPP